MGLAFAITIDSVVLFLIGFLPGIVGIFQSSHKKIAIIGALLSCCHIRLLFASPK